MELRPRLLAFAAFVALAACSKPPAPVEENKTPPKDVGFGATCTAAAQCGGRTPECDVQSGTCVQCDSTTPCPSPQKCTSTGRGGECASNGDCPANAPLCRADGTCAECLANTDCGAAAPSCSPEGQCVAACSTTAPCPNGEQCEPIANVCVQCTSNADCTSDPGNPICGGDGRCHACAENTDCGAASPFCVSFHCRQCIQNTDCGTTGVCSPDLTCEVTCTSNAQCANANGQICDTTTGACVECTSDAQCTGAHGGERPFCVTDRCEQCRTSTDCPNDKPTCEQGECH